MLSAFRFLAILIIILANSSSTLSQGYLSKFVLMDFPVNTTNFEYDNDKYIVFSINIIEGREATTIIELDENFDTIRTINYFDVFFGRFGPKKYGNRYFAYGADQTNPQRHLLVTMDNDFQEIKRDSFYPQGFSHNANCMTMIGDRIIGGAWNYYNCPELSECTFMNYKVINTEGEELQSFNVDEEGEPYFFSFEVDHTSDGDIICGGNRYELPYAKASVYKSSQDGAILWKHKNTERQSRGNVPVWVEELSNGNIVYTNKIDKIDDDDYIELGYTDRPAQLVWLSPEGETLFSYLDTVNWTSTTEFSGIKKGNGDYFFAFGEYYLNNLEPKEFDGVYAFLIKINNEGEIIWRRLYKNSDEKFSSPLIRQIYEHENGDIAMLGREVTQDGYFMWMLRVNGNGCLGTVDCDDPLLLSSEDIQGDDIEQKVNIYPNPTGGNFQMASSTAQNIISYAIYDTNGQLKYINDKYNSDDIIELSSFPDGIYILQIYMEGYQKIVKRIVKY